MHGLGAFRTRVIYSKIEYVHPTRSAAPVLLLCQGRARFERVEDDADEQPFQGAERFAAALALGLLAFQVRACVGVVAGLGDRDPVERRVQLTVATAVEPVALSSA